MKKITLFIAFILCFCLSAQTTYVPDGNFEQALIDLGYDDILDDYVTTSNIDTVTTLDLSYKSISDLTGIENFVSLTSLNLFNNSLTSLDLSSNINLEVLNCTTNQLTSLSASYNNDLNSIDITQNTELLYLSAIGGKLSSIDVNQNTLLQSLIIPNNQLTSIDLSQNTLLGNLFCYN